MTVAAAVALFVSSRREQKQLDQEREYNETLRKKSERGEPVSEAFFDEDGERVEMIDAELTETETADADIADEDIVDAQQVSR